MGEYYSNTNRPKLLAYNDRVTFHVGENTLVYEVYENHLGIRGSLSHLASGWDSEGDNDTIFNVLGINKFRIAEDTYQYDNKEHACKGIWPECKNKDYEALTRLVNKLFDLCDKANGVAPTEPTPEPDLVKKLEETTRITVVITYKCEDGSEFDTMEEAVAYQEESDLAVFLGRNGMTVNGAQNWASILMKAYDIKEKPRA